MAQPFPLFGSLYSEKNSYDNISDKLPAYMRGYVEGLCSAQKNVYGYNFIEDAISDQWVSDFVSSVGFNPLPDDYEADLKGIIADTYLNCRCTELERKHTLDAVSRHFHVDLYTQKAILRCSHMYKTVVSQIPNV